MRDHPVVEQIQKNGFPNMVAQPEHAGIDYFGFEILNGDCIVEYGGEIILKENLERFLQEELGFNFKTA